MNQKNKYKIERHDLSTDKSLKAWSAADEYLFNSIESLDLTPSHLGVYNDRFGFLACQLNSLCPSLIITNKSQEKAIRSNLELNKLNTLKFINPLSDTDNKFDCVLMKIPKSLGLFQFFLEHIACNTTENATVICSFMTRNFTPKMLQIAHEYFEVVEQSRAVKKARLLTLSQKLKTTKKDLQTSVIYNESEYRQYLGVFSANHIDYATQFFLEHIEIDKNDNKVLDLASGNGVIACELLKRNPEGEFHLMDDSYLAVASAKMNVSGENIFHHFNNDLSIFEHDSFDLIVTNPPFHFEYEINIQVPLALFKECHRCLKQDGNLQVVANKHLNYKIHLDKIFKKVVVVAEDKKFVVYKCIK